MAASKNHQGHFTYCLFQDGKDAYVELSWAPVRKDVRIISKHKTFQQAVDAQIEWYAKIGYDVVYVNQDDWLEENEDGYN